MLSPRIICRVLMTMGGKKKYLHAGLLWSANLGKDGWILQRGHTDRDQPSSANQHLSPELQLGTIFDPR